MYAHDDLVYDENILREGNEDEEEEEYEISAFKRGQDCSFHNPSLVHLTARPAERGTLTPRFCHKKYHADHNPKRQQGGLIKQSKE